MSPSKGFLCVLELQIRSITCPGVTLKAKDDLYISARILGQYKKTSSVRAIFPLLFNEKLIFEKVYTDVVDPGDLVELFELGEILATYEANTRDFLFPAPKSITGQRGSVREILMKKAFGFTGIAPKLKFFTSCLISENLLRSEKAQKQDHLNQQQCSSKDGTPHIRSPKKNPPSLERNRQCLAAKTYDQPTVASLSRSPSPYTKRRMCELQQLRQRLAHLDLGPFDFRKESDRPPFVVRRPEQPSAWCRSKDNIKDAWPETTYDPTLLGSYRPKNRKATRSHSDKDLNSFSHSYDEHLISSIAGRQLHSTHLLMHSAPPQLQKYYSTPMLNHLSLRERFHSGWSATVNGEEIHKRVRNILRTHSARQRLTFDESCLSKDDSVKTRDSSKTEDSNKKRDISDRVRLSHSDFQSSSSIRQSIMVQLDDDDYWTSQSAEYKSKPHRAIFEDSLQKIYRNMYRKASGSKSKNK
ncbi:spermatogenesis-associated protein 6 isoform X2 [Zootoca vivipara]|uniref:spermatogenesis-associated protein 6 isoform X2 n=1 Tax=Zootoca vivipara TaxID=8524 RepID=UPI00293BE937|nr:spermatogenesis-associated protein 6 isoform X2 [Zootoca vivipara]